MTNPKSESQKRRNEAAKASLGRYNSSESWHQYEMRKCGELSFIEGADWALSDLKKQLGLPEDCDVEVVVLKMKDALMFYGTIDGRDYKEDVLYAGYPGRRARKALEPFTKEQK